MILDLRSSPLKELKLSPYEIQNGWSMPLGFELIPIPKGVHSDLITNCYTIFLTGAAPNPNTSQTASGLECYLAYEQVQAEKWVYQQSASEKKIVCLQGGKPHTLHY